MGILKKAVSGFSEDTETLLLDGFMVEDDKEKISGRPYVIHHPVESGRVIYLAEPINYRGYWYGTNPDFPEQPDFRPYFIIT